MSDSALVIDVGGTRTRLALASRRDSGIALDAVQVVSTPSGSLKSVIRDYLSQHAAHPVAMGAAVAGPVDGLGMLAHARLTNHPLSVTASDLAEAGDGVPVLLCNDLGAAAASLSALSADERRLIGEPREEIQGTRVLIGVGTGIGVAAQLADGSIVSGEGGHVEAPFRDEIAERLRADGAVSIEDMLAGSQLAKLYVAACGMNLDSTPEAVMQLARVGDTSAQAALAWHARSLGAFARDCSLSFGAWAGVYLMGGAIDGLGDDFDASGFRASFETHRVFGKRLKAVPAFRIVHPYPGLLGLAERLLVHRSL